MNYQFIVRLSPGLSPQKQRKCRFPLQRNVQLMTPRVVCINWWHFDVSEAFTKHNRRCNRYSSWGWRFSGRYNFLLVVYSVLPKSVDAFTFGAMKNCSWLPNESISLHTLLCKCDNCSNCFATVNGAPASTKWPLHACVGWCECIRYHLVGMYRIKWWRKFGELIAHYTARCVSVLFACTRHTTKWGSFQLKAAVYLDFNISPFPIFAQITTLSTPHRTHPNIRKHTAHT